MARTTKADLEAENAGLKQRVAELEAKVEELSTPRTKVPSAPSARVAVSADNPVFANLPVYQPFTWINCPVDDHGKQNTNKAGLCPKCSNARVLATAVPKAHSPTSFAG